MVWNAPASVHFLRLRLCMVFDWGYGLVVRISQGSPRRFGPYNVGQCMDNVAICMEIEEWEVRQRERPHDLRDELGDHGVFGDGTG
jgi:hypothetical protein